LRTRPIPLSRLFAEVGDPEQRISFGRKGEATRRNLLRDVSALATRTSEVGRGRWLLFTDDSYAMAVGLLALGSNRSLAVLPPNRQPETLRLLADGAVGALVDGEVARVAGLPALPPLDPGPAGTCARAMLDRDAPLAEFRTSGTTGEGQPVGKALRHLEDEIAVLEERLGSLLPADARIFATASHQHIYGLLFRVLWPLATGRAFHAETLLHTQELLPRLLACESAALVTTPVHLKRLVASADLRALRGICRAVFSSGGPLDPATAAAVAKALGAAPIEILGSTETGGIAIRRRDIDGEIWHPLPEVEIGRRDADARLLVTSPFVSVGDDVGDGRARALLGDRIELAPDAGFRLLDRADRVVKVGEKRLSLPEMERALGEDSGVEEVALLVLEHAGERRVHAVVAPSPVGQQLLAREGRRALRAALTQHLAERFDPVLLPRAWRFVDALPRDAQDKVPQAALRALFADRATGRPTAPKLIAQECLPDGLVRHLEVPDDLAQLEGHFEGFPLVAGVVQLGWVLAAAAEWLGNPPQLVGLEALKFPEPLRPGRSVTLELRRSADGRVLRFRIHGGRSEHASGRAILAEARGPGAS
jgi:3-hydroxymyristoyl/3-hydroxydecanoyl-(acyl carrier protein) dehydratase